MSSSVSPRMSSSSWWVVGFVLLFFMGSYAGREWLKGSGVDRSDYSDGLAVGLEVPKRIVGLAPSTVEVLYELGLGDRVVGVSRYGTYPPESMEKPKIAGFLDVDYETLLALKPDCIVMVESQRGLVEKFHQLGLRTVVVEHSSVNGIIESFNTIGDACGKNEEAERIVEAMRTHLDETRQKWKGQTRPRVLVCIERDPDSPRPDRVIAAGSGGFHRELIEIAGGVNAYQGGIAYPVLSREKLLNLNPDVIIDLVRGETYEKYTEPVLLKQWYAFGELNAVKHKRVVIVAGNQHLIPGPRFLGTLDAFVDAVHPK